MKRLSAEANLAKMMLCAFAVFAVGMFLTVILPPLVAPSWGKRPDTARPLTDAEAAGRHIFVREGCTGCHTQQVRHLEPDTKRFGWRGTDAPPSAAAEYAGEQPHQLGTRRVGPDLSHIGGKYDSSWHYAHLKNPRAMSPGSVMPSYAYLTAAELRQVTAYLQTLGRTQDWRHGRGDYEE